MSDYEIKKTTLGVYDFVAENGDFKICEGLDTQILYAIFGERRADSSEVVRPEFRRGWIGNESADYENGSKVWLYFNSRLTQTAINGIQAEARGGLNYLIDNNVFADITTSVDVGIDSIALKISLIRDDETTDQRFLTLIESTGNQSNAS